MAMHSFTSVWSRYRICNIGKCLYMQVCRKAVTLSLIISSIYLYIVTHVNRLAPLLFHLWIHLSSVLHVLHIHWKTYCWFNAKYNAHRFWHTIMQWISFTIVDMFGRVSGFSWRHFWTTFLIWQVKPASLMYSAHWSNWVADEAGDAPHSVFLGRGHLAERVWMIRTPNEKQSKLVSQWDPLPLWASGGR